jgi:hypothetical protein
VIHDTPPPRAALRAGYETRDVDVPLVVGVVILFVLLGLALILLLWEMSRQVVPEQMEGGTSPPVVMPGEAPVNNRIEAIPQPRLDPLEPLESGSQYRSSRALPQTASPTQRPEDLRADRQPQLNRYEWVEPGKAARIPIGRAMDAIVASEQAKSSPKKGAEK